MKIKVTKQEIRKIIKEEIDSYVNTYSYITITV